SLRSMKRNWRYRFLFACLVFCINAQSQVSVNFNASLYGRSLEGLSFAQIVNTSAQPVHAKIKVTIREMTQGTVVTVQIPYFQLRTGTNRINSQSFSRSNFIFAGNRAGRHLSQTAKFSEGEYEFCFEVTVGDPKTLVVT